MVADLVPLAFLCCPSRVHWSFWGHSVRPDLWMHLNYCRNRETFAVDRSSKTPMWGSRCDYLLGNRWSAPGKRERKNFKHMDHDWHGDSNLPRISAIWPNTIADLLAECHHWRSADSMLTLRFLPPVQTNCFAPRLLVDFVWSSRSSVVSKPQMILWRRLHFCLHLLPAP